jgi:hypothetical protein
MLRLSPLRQSLDSFADDEDIEAKACPQLTEIAVCHAVDLGINVDQDILEIHLTEMGQELDETLLGDVHVEVGNLTVVVASSDLEPSGHG